MHFAAIMHGTAPGAGPAAAKCMISDGGYGRLEAWLAVTDG
jgi:hypothetical protein